MKNTLFLLIGLASSGHAMAITTPAPASITTPVGTVEWVEGGSYQWRTAGNHADHSTLLMHHVGTDAVVTVSFQDAYTDTETYNINLSQGTVDAQLHSYFGKTDHADFSLLPLGSGINAAFKPLAQVMIGRVQDLAAGYDAGTYGSAPAAPELQPLVEALQNAVGH